MLENAVTVRVIAVVVLYLFLPVTAISYLLFQRKRRALETDRIMRILKVESREREVFEIQKTALLWAVGYASIVTLAGLSLVFLAGVLGLREFPGTVVGNVAFPQPGSRFICGMAFLGAYVWGLQYLFRRHALDDLTPSVYYSLGMRMILAGLVAFVLYNGYEALTGADDGGTGITAKSWPVMAALIGMFPRRGLRWISSRVPFLSTETSQSVRNAPVSMIEGVEGHDQMRLEELGIDTCYDLATADFVPLVLNTPYSPRQLIDWILQAKLIVHFGEVIGDLRERCIRTILDRGTWP